MSSTDRIEAAAVTASGSHDEVVLLDYTVHLMRRRPAGALLVAIAVLAVACVGQFLLRSTLLALVGVAVLLGSTAEFVLPIRYTLTTEKATAACGPTRLAIEWSRVRRVARAGEAIHLSPFAAPNRLDAFRGITLRSARDGQPGELEQLLRIARECAPEARIDG
jgi:hypothetical protein